MHLSKPPLSFGTSGSPRCGRDVIQRAAQAIGSALRALRLRGRRSGCPCSTEIRLGHVIFRVFFDLARMLSLWPFSQRGWAQPSNYMLSTDGNR